MAKGGQEKTEKPTAKRVRDARKKGQVARSRDLSGAMGLLATSLYIFLTRDKLLSSIQQYFGQYFSNFINIKTPEQYLWNSFFQFAENIFFLFLPLLLLSMIIAIGANVAQFGFLFSPETLKPKLMNINPFSVFERFFSLQTLVEFVKSILKIIVIGGTVYLVISAGLPTIMTLSYAKPAYMFNATLSLVLKILLWGGLTYFTLAVLDYYYQKYDYEKNLRMTKQETKEEHKQSEGDPRIKGWIRRRQRQILMNAIRKEVPKATVVVTNPTHFAAALYYKKGYAGAPKLTAKGADFLARRIKQIAQENNVPMMENREVARFLYHHVDVGQEIPVEIYQAVAQILAVVFNQKK